MQSQRLLYKLENVTKAYGERTVLAIPELSFVEGQTCALVGPNGSGKTSLLRLLAVVDRPTSGRIFFNSDPLWNGSGRQIELARRVTMVAHPPYLFNRSVAYNISYGMKIRGASRTQIQKKMQEVLALTGLLGFEKREARKLSSGEQQRVALARAIALEPAVLLLDEPTASIDKKHSLEIETFIKRLSRQKGITVIFSTHNQQQASSLAEKVISLYEGRVQSLAYDNFFAGTPYTSGGRTWIKIHEDVSFEISGPVAGDIHVWIDPRDILVSRQHVQSPRLNCFRGRLMSMAMQESLGTLTFDVGISLTSAISRDDLKRLGPRLDEEFYCLFDASAVRIIENGKTAETDSF